MKIAGHLEQLPNKKGSWRYRASFGYGPDGKRNEYRATFGDRTWSKRKVEAHARDLLHQWEAEQATRAEYKDTFRELLDEAKRRGRAEQTDYRARSIHDRILARFGNRKLSTITARDLDRWYDDLLKNGVEREYMSKGVHKTKRVKLSPSTVHHHHREIHALLEKAYKWDMVQSNVADKATPPKVRKRDQAKHMPTPAALSVLVQATTNRNLRMAILLGAATGCRAGEIVALRWSDLRGGVLYVAESLSHVPGGPLKRKETKSGDEKRVLLFPDVLEALQEHRAWQVEQARKAGMVAVSGPILANWRSAHDASQPYSAAWLSLAWSRLCDDCGVPDFKFHGLRHMHDSLMNDGGISLAAAAKRSGHSVQVMADRYVHSLDETDRRAAEVIGAALGDLFALNERNET